MGGDEGANDDDDEIAAAGSRSLARVLALSDAVFAIAMTLLVLTLNLPEGVTVGDAIRDTRPQLIAYGFSFAVIAILWMSHHRLFNVIIGADSTLLVINLVYLGLIALVPFPTNVLGDHSTDQAAVVFYAAILGLTGIAGSLSSLHVLRSGLAEPGIPRHALVHGTLRGVSFAAVFLLSIPIALWWSPAAAEWAWVLVFVIHLLLRRHFGADRPIRMTRS